MPVPFWVAMGVLCPWPSLGLPLGYSAGAENTLSCGCFRNSPPAPRPKVCEIVSCAVPALGELSPGQLRDFVQLQQCTMAVVGGRIPLFVYGKHSSVNMLYCAFQESFEFTNFAFLKPCANDTEAR